MTGLRLELRYSGAISLAVTLVLVGVVSFFGLSLLPEPDSAWSSSWGAGTRWLSGNSVVLAPFAGAVAAWAGARERRRRIGELLESTARPPVQRRLITWAALGLGVTTALMLISVLVAAAVAPGATWTDNRVGIYWLLVALGLLSCTALGFSAGRLLPGRVAAPATALGLLLLGMFANVGQGSITLSPIGRTGTNDGGTMAVAILLPLSGWVISLGLAGLVLGTARSRWPAAIALVLVVITGLLLSSATGRVVNGRDPVAAQLVCTDAAPQVCVLRGHAAMLPAVAPLARDLIRELAPVSPIRRAVETDEHHWTPVGPDTLELPALTGRSLRFRAGLAHPETVRTEAVLRVVHPDCVDDVQAGSGHEAAKIAATVAGWLIGGVRDEEDAISPDRAAVTALQTRLAGDARATRIWLRDYLRAASACDYRQLDRLGR